MRVTTLVLALAMCGSIDAKQPQLEERETSLDDIRQYQAQLLREVDRGRMRSIPLGLKKDLRQRSEELSGLLDSPTAQTNEAELAHIGEMFVKFQDAADAAALEVVHCRRMGNVGSRLAEKVCTTEADREILRQRSRKTIEDINWNNIPPTG